MEGGARGFVDFKLGVWTLLASGFALNGEDIFEVRELVSLLWTLKFG